MLGKYLGVDITEDSITAVLVKSGLQGHRIIACAAVSVRKSGSREAAMAELLEQIKPEGAECICAIPADRLSYRNLSLPFKDKKKIRQIIAFELETMIPFPIDDLLVDFTIAGRSPERADILAAAVKRSFLADFLAFFENQGVAPEVVEIRSVPVVSWLLGQATTPDNGLFLDISPESATIILFLEKRIVLIRKVSIGGEKNKGKADDNGKDISAPDKSEIETDETVFMSFCKTVQNTLMAFVDQTDEERRPEKVFITGRAVYLPHIVEILGRFLGLPVEGIDLCSDPRIQIDEKLVSNWKPALMDNALALAIRESGKGPGFNFRREEFEIKRQFLKFGKELRTGISFLIVILTLLITDLGVDYYGLKKRYQLLDGEVRAIFSETLPEVQRVVDPVQQMRVKVNELKKTAGSLAGIGIERKVLDLMGDISQRVPNNLSVKVNQMIIDQEAIQMRGTTDTFNTVDTIKKGLDSSTYFAEVAISSANLDRTGQAVRFEIRMQLAE